MGRGDFGKAFSEHRKNGGTLTRRDFAIKWNQEHGKPQKEYKSKDENPGMYGVVQDE